MSEPSSRSLEQAHEALMYDEGTFASVVRNVALALDAARAEALEQAAMRCEGSTEGGSIFAAERVAAAIRALKEKP